MYLGTTADTCIPHVSRINPCMYPTCIRHDASKIHVSWFCISLYPDVSWWRIQDTRIVMYLIVSWHVSSVPPRKRPRYMYLDVFDVYPKMYLGLVWDTCKIHAQCEGYMYSLGM
jgi:hypothetical protein